MGLLNVAAAALLAGSSNCPPIAETAQPVAPATVTPALPAANPQIAPTAASDQPAAPPQPVLPEGAVQSEAPQPVTDTATVDGTVPVSDNGDVIVVTAKRAPSSADPVEAINEVTFGAVQALDSALVAPVAHGYEEVVPGPLRQGIHNVLNNLDEPIVFVNFLLQLKIGKAFETLGRFAINSTIGIGGLIDVAKRKPFNLPRRSNGLADTLGYYGVGPGPYFFLPLIGSTSLRDVLGRIVDLSILPTALAKPFAQPIISLSKATLSSIDERVENDEVLTRVHDARDPYAAMREYYLTKRQAEIDVLKGKRANADITLDDLKSFKTLAPPAPAPLPANDNSAISVPVCPTAQ